MLEMTSARCGLHLNNCQSLCKTLGVSGCAGCDTTLASILEAVDTTNPEHISALESAGLSSVLNVEAGENLRRHNFSCEVFGHAVVATCGLTDCGYYVPNAPEAGNCLVQYLKQSGKDISSSDLSLDEVATLEGVPPAEVRKVQRNAMRQLAANVVHSAVHDGDLNVSLHYIPDMPVCVVCESRVFPGSGGKEATLFNEHQYYYCSDACLEQHPIYALECEVRFGVSFRELMRWVVKNFGSLGSAERALNLTRVQMYAAASKYLDDDLETHFESLRGLKERRSSHLVKRTWHYPRLFAERAEALRRSVLIKAEARYGISKIEVEGILKGVESLIGPDKARMKSKKSPRRTSK